MYLPLSTTKLPSSNARVECMFSSKWHSLPVFFTESPVTPRFEPQDTSRRSITNGKRRFIGYQIFLLHKDKLLFRFFYLSFEEYFLNLGKSHCSVFPTPPICFPFKNKEYLIRQCVFFGDSITTVMIPRLIDNARNLFTCKTYSVAICTLFSKRHLRSHFLIGTIQKEIFILDFHSPERL